MSSHPAPPPRLGHSTSSTSSLQAQAQQPGLQGQLLEHHERFRTGAVLHHHHHHQHVPGTNSNTVNAAAQTVAPTPPTQQQQQQGHQGQPTEIPTLYPPELFATIHEGIYRCTSIDYSSREFLKTLNLKTILTLTVEKPRSPLRNLSTSLSIQLIHSALWTGASPSTTLSSSTTTTTQPIWEEPAWKQAVDQALAYLAPEYRPVLVVDGVGVFCGVVRRGVMGWGVTGTILEYRSFFWGGAGGGGRYGCEEVVEMVDGEGGWGGLGVDDLRVGWGGVGDRGEGGVVVDGDGGLVVDGDGGEKEEEETRGNWNQAGTMAR